MEKSKMVMKLTEELKFITEPVLTHLKELELMKLTMLKIKLTPNPPLPLWLTSENNKMPFSDLKKEDMNTLSLFFLMPQISLIPSLLVKPVFLNYLPTPWLLLPLVPKSVSWKLMLQSSPFLLKWLLLKKMYSLTNLLLTESKEWSLKWLELLELTSTP